MVAVEGTVSTGIMEASAEQRGSGRIPPPATPEKGLDSFDRCACAPRPTVIQNHFLKNISPSSIQSALCTAFLTFCFPPRIDGCTPLRVWCLNAVRLASFLESFRRRLTAVFPHGALSHIFVSPGLLLSVLLKILHSVKVHFKPIANAPILRKSKFQVNAAWTYSEVRDETAMHSSASPPSPSDACQVVSWSCCSTALIQHALLCFVVKRLFT